jgi:hypothetical protein
VRNLRARDKELLRELADGGLLDEIQERAELKLFNKFRAAGDADRFQLGLTCDALKAVIVELQATINEAVRDGPTDNANAA